MTGACETHPYRLFSPCVECLAADSFAKGKAEGIAEGCLAVRRELSDAIDRFNADDSKGMGDILEFLDPFFLDDEEVRAYEADKSERVK